LARNEVASFVEIHTNDIPELIGYISFEFVDIYDNAYRQKLVFKPHHGGFFQTAEYLGKR